LSHKSFEEHLTKASLNSSTIAGDPIFANILVFG